jgi:hypothetical protein
VRAVEGTPVVRGAVVFCELSIRETALATLIRQRRLAPSCGGQPPTTTTLSHMIRFSYSASRWHATPVSRISAGWANFVRLNHDRQNGYLVAWRFCRVPLCAESQIVQYGDAEST